VRPADAASPSGLDVVAEEIRAKRPRRARSGSAGGRGVAPAAVANVLFDVNGKHMHAVVGADSADAYKPDPRVYQNTIDVLDLDPAETWFVAGHWWDVVTGARRVGRRTAWVARDGGVLLAIAPEPDVTADDLKAAAEAIAAATAGGASRPRTPRPGSR